MLKQFGLPRALLFASVCVASLGIVGPAVAGSVTVTSGQTYSTEDLVSGTDAVVVDNGGTYTSTASTAAIVWSGLATGAGVTITNNGTMEQLVGAPNPLQSLFNLPGGTGGTLTINNFGTMTGALQPLIGGIGGGPTGNVVINNDGTMTNTTTSLNGSLNGAPYLITPVVINVIALPSMTGNLTINNDGTMNGAIHLGAGTNVVNLTTSSVITGDILGTGSNNTINLSGAGSSFAYGSNGPPTYVPPGVVGNPGLTFYGWQNIQTVNVNSGTWSLVGAGAYSNVTVASAATFNVCDVTSAISCGAGYNGSNGTPSAAGATVSNNVATSGNVAINGTAVNVQGTFTQTGGSTLLSNGGSLTANGGIIANGGTIGGNGTLIGPVTVNGGTVQVGASPDPLNIQGNFTQTGGQIDFEIDPNGKGGFLESTLVFQPGSTVSITDANIYFDFLGGADFKAFVAAGDFNINTFFGGINIDSALQDDTFSTNVPGVNIGGFNPITGQILVPEPITFSLFGTGLAGAFAMRRRKKKSV